MTQPTYTSSQVARAAGMSSDNFRAQFARDNWRLMTNERPANGQAHKFTLAQAMVYALARKLTECGYKSARAFEMALEIGAEDWEASGRVFFLASGDGCAKLVSPGELAAILDNPRNPAAVTVLNLGAFKTRLSDTLEALLP